MTEEMLKLEIGRFVGSRIATRIARAQSMRRQAQAMLKRADEEDAKTEWYRREAAAGLTLGGSHARAQALHDPASGCWGAVEPLAPDLPTQTREALAEIDAWIERSRATTCRPETLKEIRAHLLMIRRHLERARLDLAARLWASPVAEVASLSVDPILAASIGKRAFRGRAGRARRGRDLRRDAKPLAPARPLGALVPDVVAEARHGLGAGHLHRRGPGDMTVGTGAAAILNAEDSPPV